MSKPKSSPKNVCHWHCCQKPQTPTERLCVEHVALSKVLGLSVPLK